MNTAGTTDVCERLREALDAPDPSARLQAALDAGTRPESDCVSALIERCGTETDFYVRDMLTWSLARHPVSVTLPLLLEETKSTVNQARSQALHTLSKIGDPRGWVAITPELLRDADHEVARSAWRAAVVLVPPGARARLARELSSQFGRGDRDVQLSLSRALATLGNAARSVIAEAAMDNDTAVRTHAIATERLILNPDEGFDTAIFEARRVIALANVPMVVPKNDGLDQV